MSISPDATHNLSPAPGAAGSQSSTFKIRRVVTGHSPDGKSIFLSDGEPPRQVSFKTIPEQEYVEIWSTEQIPSLSTTGASSTNEADPTVEMTSFVPGPGGTRFGIVVIPPDSVVMDAVLRAGGPGPIFQEFHARLPGLAEASEVDHPGMHTTNTLDYDIIVSGEAWLELDNSAEVHLQQGDFIVQHGVRHAWHNRSSAPCVLAYIMIGATKA